jgi:carbon-monoxide dehydrogenase large subunit
VTPSVGRSVPRVEDRPLLTGAAEFVDDVALPGILHASFVRSPLARAHVKQVDLEPAMRLGAVAAVAAGELGLPPLHPPIEAPNSFSPPRPLLADAYVRFAGEPLAVVLAESPYLAEDAARVVGLDLEPLEPLPDPTRAMEEGAPLLHEGWGSNVLYESQLEVGDVDAAFADAAAVVERTFRNPRYCATPIEPRGIVAAPDGDGVRVWSSSQAPHSLRSLLAKLLGLDIEAVRVTCADIGGGFGQKCHVYPEDIVVAALALRLGRPCKWIEDRSENLLASSHARDQHLRVRAAADADGRLLALDADVVCDTGAYGVFPHGHLLEALGTPAMLPGPYRLPAYRARSRSVATSKCPEGAYRGVGLPVSAFVHERLMDLLAAELEIDRGEIRRRNFVRSEEMPYTTVTNQRYDSGDYATALGRALDAIGWERFPEEQAAARAEGRLVGIGVSSYVEYTAPNSAVFQGRGMVGIAGYDGAHVTLDADGRATVWTTLPGIGQGVQTTFAQLVADEIGLDVSQVTVKRSDTAVGGLEGTGAFASRSAVSGGGAVLGAGAELRGRLLEDASERLEAAESDLEIVDGIVRPVGVPAAGVPVAELVAAADGDRYRVSSQFDPPHVAYPYATHACRVEVDVETGAISIERYVVVEDCGRIINPAIADGQAHGAVAQGIGGTLLEEIAYDGDCQLRTSSLMDYLVPTSMEVPALELSHLEIPAPDSPNGAKGVGEGGTLAPPAAVANAVSDALGAELNELPLTPERVIAAARRVLREPA